MPAAAVTIRAPAKLNLSLAVLERRADGFHEIESLFVPVDYADTLAIATGGPPGIRLRVRFAGPLATPRGRVLARDVPADATNLVVRAAAALAAEAGLEPAVDIDLVKRIPSGAGLGGGSSDAAAVVTALAEAWGLPWPRDRLAGIGAGLGSDIPWFFTGVAAVARGRGERIEPVEPFGPMFAVIACPPQGLSTAAVYRACTPSRARAGDATALAAALAAGDLRAARALMHNDLEPPARSLSPEIDRLLADLERVGGACPRLTGSGSACFALCRTRAEARGVGGRLAALADEGRPRWPAVVVSEVGAGARRR